MRPFMVAPLTLGLAALALAVVPSGCSGASEQDVFQAPSAAGNASGGTTSGGTTSGGTTSGGTTSGGADASAPDASSACPAEEEPNDARDEANTLEPSRCGVIQPNSESDFLTFQLSPKSTSMQLRFDGQVTLKVEVDGDSVTLGGGKFPSVPFVKGKRYVVEIKATERATSVPWRVDLIEK